MSEGIEDKLVKTVKTYKYSFGEGCTAEVEISGKYIKSIYVYIKGQGRYTTDDILTIRQTKQFEALVKVFNQILEDFYGPKENNNDH